MGMLIRIARHHGGRDMASIFAVRNRLDLEILLHYGGKYVSVE